MMANAQDIQKRLMKLAREVDALTWADRKCIGEAIALLSAPMLATQAPAAVGLTDDEIKRVLSQSDLLDMHQHMGWYSAPETAFKKHGIALARDIERAIEVKRATLSAPMPAGAAVGLVDQLRSMGWAVAVHNDYRLGGEAHTFWLFTKDGRAVKGEGRTDDEALRQVLAATTPTTGGASTPTGGVGS